MLIREFARLRLGGWQVKTEACAQAEIAAVGAPGQHELLAFKFTACAARTGEEKSLAARQTIQIEASALSCVQAGRHLWNALNP
jgi:hypothetical protein